MPASVTLLEALGKWLQSQPEKVLYTFLDAKGKQLDQVTYATLHQRSEALARYLISPKGLGLARGDRVLLVYPPSLDFIIAFWACLRACLIGVPVFPPDPRKLKKDLYMFASIQKSSGGQVALTSNEYNFVKKMADIKRSFTSDSTRWPELKWIVTDKVPSCPPLHYDPPAPNSVAFLQYTSGSTSEPKGVMITHENLAHNITIFCRALKAGTDTVVASWLPQYHDMGLIGSYLGACHCGGSGVYTSPFSFIRDPPFWMTMVTKYNATHLQAPNFAYGLTARKFEDKDRQGRAPQLALASIRHMINAAEPVDVSAIEKFNSTFAPKGLDASHMYPTYGLAEHTVYVCTNGKQCLSVDKDALESESKVVIVPSSASSRKVIVGCGFPGENEGLDLRIVNPDTSEQLPDDHVGEIWMDSPSKARGYWNLEVKTQEDFFAKIEGEGASATRYLRTGDLGFLHKGELFICGRIKDLIIIRGRNHYPQDIERTIETDARIRPGCSAAFSITTGGSAGEGTKGSEALILIAELRDPAKVDASELAKLLRTNVSKVHGVQLAGLSLLKPKTVPKTTSGKIARRWCRVAYEGKQLQEVYRHEADSNDDSGADSGYGGDDGAGRGATSAQPMTMAPPVPPVNPMRCTCS
jgi:acyl-CoA synthetase (AMP-forming)/AMP-acid ligase II